jgi:hypothetical protein
MDLPTRGSHCYWNSPDCIHCKEGSDGDLGGYRW